MPTTSLRAGAMPDLHIGPISRPAVFGGGPLTARLCEWAAEAALPIAVITAPRHASLTLPRHGGMTFAAFLSARGIPNCVSESLASPLVHDAIGTADAAQTLYLSLGAAWIFRKNFIAE